jgi:TetR/AcrR family transcriptional regulator, transcriptional repressor for nem operon
MTKPTSRVHSRRAQGKAQTHERIIASAAHLVRRAGLTATSVPRVMRGAGLTVGGFYAHFRSKRALDAAVIARAMREVRESWFAGLEHSAGSAFLARAVKRYLSLRHRDDVANGCVLPSTISELTRADRGTRLAMAEAVEQVAAVFERHAAEAMSQLPAERALGMTPRERALSTLALLVGGLTTARALRGHPLSDELLAACIKLALPDPATRKSRRGPRSGPVPRREP